ncbi:GPI-anchored cell wall organization protein Ecm33 [Aspergillus sclerotioniger CBS 115572]|uniref:GPI-anchored cell wall organization protein Ecm33 n=1 Tax=Aspergillus sclerotioniger CBS 115572 TaxID=1450535 RepID=A0A317X7Y1_9EURO|nr:GPI-anchored cell wall organization protein Ecm33 [Aspergillus sclerotioniger CBS 115572]PWY93742.1 GPI-anchored cell wall organization protein Ecm33 [Aspergillus sclerotioniger CBS 115572]
MAFVKYALPVVAAAQAALAASCGSTDSTITISSQSDLDSYATCPTLKGNVEISEHASGDLTLSGVYSITGGLSCTDGSNITSLSSSSLSSIGEAFKLDGLTTLTTLSFTNLTSVGSISWTALPELQALDFTKGVSQAGSVEITNTGLTSLDGISLKTVGAFDITENTNLKTVNVNELTNATGLINFAGNLDSLEIILPNLGTGTNMTIRNVSGVSLPSLETLSGQLGFWGNTFNNFSAPNLTSTADLVFDDNTKLANISMPVLKTVNGGFQIARNDKLKGIDFPDLKEVTGAIDFSGDFDSVSLSALTEVKGGFNMQSTGNFSCSAFKTLRENNVIRGTYTCKASTTDPTTSDGSSGTTTSTTSSGTSSATSSDSASVMNVANLPALGLAAIIGAVFAL